MKLTEQQVTLRKLTPKAGMWLTRIDATTDRVFTKEVFLGINDSPDNWREATEEEKLEYEAAEKARLEAEQAEYEAQNSGEIL